VSVAPGGDASVDAEESAVFSDEEREDSDQDSACQDEGEGGAEHEPGGGGRIEPGTQGSTKGSVLVGSLPEIPGCGQGGPGQHVLGQQQAEKEDAASYRD
jgi:hypothetical protein